MSNDAIIGGHPLDGADADRCYDVLMSERNALLTAKRSAEDETIKGVIRFSQAALLLIPGAVLTLNVHLPHKQMVLLAIGIILFVCAVLSSFAEQLLSSRAYDKQIKVVTAYYQKRSAEVDHPKSANRVRWAIRASFTFFFLALAFSTTSLSWFALEASVANKPTRPSPTPSRPSPGGPIHKDGGRSVPPAAPPPPPPSKK